MSKYALTDIIADILGHPVSERNQNAVVRCPFHDDRLPSLSIDLDRGLWICFGCGLRGGLHSLATRLNAEVDDVEVTLRSYEAAANNPYFEEAPDFASLAEKQRGALYADKPDILVDFILTRELDPRVVKHFGLGWDRTGNRISFPYYRDGTVFGVKYRDRWGNKTSETGSKRGVYNVDDVVYRPYVILCEGESDTLAVWSRLTNSSLPATVKERIGVGGIPGVAGSKSQWETWALDFLWAKRVYVAYDADEAGDKGAELPMAALGDKAVRLRPTMGKDMTEHFLNGGTLGEYGLEDATSLPDPTAF
jgi:DNA primase